MKLFYRNKSSYFRLFAGISMFATCIALADERKETDLQKSEKVYVVKDGKAILDIVIPENPLLPVKAAADELQYHIKRATGITLQIKKESVASFPAIYLGACLKTKLAGIDSNGLKANGYKIHSQNGNLFILGDDNDNDPFRFPKYSTYARTGTMFGVYDLLEREMGVRWLWPGKLGEVIPPRGELEFSRQDIVSAPRFEQKRWISVSQFGNSDAGWKSKETAKEYYRDESVWLRRHRFAQSEPMSGSHAFGDWWNRFGKTHQEWFAQMPDGSRGIDPRQINSQKVSHAIAMCISNESLRKKLIEEWSKKGERCINAGENDVNGRCTCAACMAMDMRDEDPLNRMETVRKAFNENTEDSRWLGWPLSLGPLSDRYSKFLLKVQTDVKKIRRNAIVVGCAYANWLPPPIRTKLNDGIYIQVVPAFYFPFTDKRREEFRKIWNGWHATDAMLLLRPNYTLSGHNMPIFYARKLGEDLAWFAKNGMIGAQLDSLIGQWSTQGPNHYVVARLLEHPELPVDKVFQEYYNAFGPAANDVDAYFRYWEKVSDALNEDLLERIESGRADYVNSFGAFYRSADTLFTPDVMAKGRELLIKAKASASGDEIAYARVAFLEAGLRNVELTLAVETVRRESEKSGDNSKFVEMLRELDRFRAQNEIKNISNMHFLWRMETKGNKSGVWDRELLKSK